MANLACETSEHVAVTPAGPVEALATLAGLEVGVFGRTVPVFAPTCARSCLTSPDGGSAEGACPVVLGLADGVVPENREDPGPCDRGHLIAVYPGVGPGAAVLLLRPSCPDTSGPRAVRPVDRMRAAGAVWQHLDRLAQENHGLALELISSYEQLNVIFDITKQVGAVHDVGEIKLFLLRMLTDTLSCDWAWCVSSNEGTPWSCDDGRDDKAATTQWVRETLAAELDTVAQQRQILVRNRGTDLPGEAPYGVMIGPLDNGDGTIDAVVLGRRPHRREFQSGEMRMLDTVLSHGGQVIANLRLTARLKTLSMETVLALVSAIDKKDAYTSGHSQRVGFLSRITGEEMGLSGADLQDLEWAGILHDVGKIGIGDVVLKKPTSLTSEEFNLIRQHPRMSFEVIEPLRSFEAVRRAVLHHHETPDGQGYPDGLRGDEIPLPARIVHVADTFDALTSHRSYRRGYSIGHAIEAMRAGVGTKIDLHVMAAFEKALEAFRTRQPERFREMFIHVEGLAE
mgnify:CR=1 FL=1